MLTNTYHVINLLSFNRNANKYFICHKDICNELIIQIEGLQIKYTHLKVQGWY